VKCVKPIFTILALKGANLVHAAYLEVMGMNQIVTPTRVFVDVKKMLKVNSVAIVNQDILILMLQMTLVAPHVFVLDTLQFVDQPQDMVKVGIL
jgi:hypothetical protein